jgi:UDP-N-acetyl-D-mannosaminuronate dehydrogenase
MSKEWDLQICCMGAGYVGGPTMAVIAQQCPKVRRTINNTFHVDSKEIECHQMMSYRIMACHVE